MSAANNQQAIILRRVKFREYDSRITIYSRETGRLDLVVRGTARTKSKLAAHIEPFNLVNVMIIPGKQYDYAGSVFAEDCFSDIKKSLIKIENAGTGIRIFNQLVKEGLADEKLFILLYDFLLTLNSLKDENKVPLIKSAFIYKLLSELGHGADLHNCVHCRAKLKEEKNLFDFQRGGVLCCHEENSGKCLTISANCIKLLRLIEANDLIYLANIKENKSIFRELSASIQLFYNYLN